jgi:hypothetical protein
MHLGLHVSWRYYTYIVDYFRVNYYLPRGGKRIVRFAAPSKTGSAAHFCIRTVVDLLQKHAQA